MIGDGKVKANFSLSFGWRGMVWYKKKKKASLRSRMQRQDNNPMEWLWVREGQAVLKSCNSLHLPNFFLITKIGVFQGLRVGSICPVFNYSSTRAVTAANFSPSRATGPPRLDLLRAK
jgi:hypothetical protein